MEGRVLITDDDPAIQKVLTLGLSRAGFETRVASAGQLAVDLLTGGEFEPDCILLDIRMTGLTGLDVLPILKRERPLTPVIMLTALVDLDAGIQSMKRGAFDYLVKPVQKADVIDAIRKAIRYRDLLVENERLAAENREYQAYLELKVEERTAELFSAYRKLQKVNLETVRVLAETIEAKDPYTRGHCNRVRLLAVRLYDAVRPDSKDPNEREILEYGALLHDIGKIGIPEGLLHKNGRLTDEEVRIFNQHPTIGANILKEVEFFRPCLPIVRSHHEWHDGHGYPDGLKGDEIDFLVKIVSVADAFDAMTSTRPYRLALPVDRALGELSAGKGVQFDPELVDLFLGRKAYLAVQRASYDEAGSRNLVSTRRNSEGRS